MSKVLPVIFSTPAVILAALNLLLDMESALEWVLDLDQTTFRNRDSVARSRSYNEAPIDIDDDLLVGSNSVEEGNTVVAGVAAGAEDSTSKYINTYQDYGDIYDSSSLKRVIELLQLLPVGYYPMAQ